MNGHPDPQPHPRVLAPARPALPPPPGACDTHAHIFGPYDRFPLPPGATYRPPATPLTSYLHLLDRLRLTRGVLVHASAYGLDCSLLLEALQTERARLRGVAVASASISDAALQQMREVGVCGLRFSRFSDPVQQARFKNSVGFEELEKLAPRMRELGLHAQLWADCTAFVEAAPWLLKLGIPIVLDHMGYFDVARGPSDRDFARLLAELAGGEVWAKLSPHRNSKRLPACEDVRPFHDALLRANPKRLLWGSDWPYLNMGETTPDAGLQLDQFADWTGDAGLAEQILVRNPEALYGFATAEHAS